MGDGLEAEDSLGEKELVSIIVVEAADSESDREGGSEEEEDSV